MIPHEKLLSTLCEQWDRSGRHFTPGIRATTEDTDTPNGEKDVGQLEPHLLLVGLGNGTTSMENCYKVKHSFTQKIPLLAIYQKKKNCLQKDCTQMFITVLFPQQPKPGNSPMPIN